MHSITIGYYGEVYANKLNNLEVMGKYLEAYNLPRMNRKEIEKLNRPITHKEFELVI